jgi:hypothetical protein
MRSIFTGAKKCGVAKHHKGRKPDWCFAQPEPPDRAVSVYSPVMRCLGAHYTILFIFSNYYNPILFSINIFISLHFVFFYIFNESIIPIIN